jgi:hypothetical protein
MHPLRLYLKWLFSFKPAWLYEAEASLKGKTSWDPEKFREYVNARIGSEIGTKIYNFYNKVHMKFRKWQLQVSLKKVMDQSVTEALRLVGCNGGTKWDDKNGVISIGLGEFRFHPGLVHSKFCRYIDPFVVGANEYYKTKNVHDADDENNRERFCQSCNKYLNRDLAAVPAHLCEPILGGNSTSLR